MDSGGGPGNKETLSLLFTKPAESGHPYLEAQGSMDNGVPWMQSPDFEKTPILHSPLDQVRCGETSYHRAS